MTNSLQLDKNITALAFLRRYDFRVSEKIGERNDETRPITVVKTFFQYS